MYNLWENMHSKAALCFGFLALYSEHVSLLSCYKLVLQQTHRLCSPGQYCTMRTDCCVHDYSIQLQVVLVIGSYTLHKPMT